MQSWLPKLQELSISVIKHDRPRLSGDYPESILVAISSNTSIKHRSDEERPRHLNHGASISRFLNSESKFSSSSCDNDRIVSCRLCCERRECRNHVASEVSTTMLKHRWMVGQTTATEASAGLPTCFLPRHPAINGPDDAAARAQSCLAVLAMGGPWSSTPRGCRP